MRILVLTSTFPRYAGDTEPKFVLNLCQYLATANEIDVVAPHCKGTPTEEQIDSLHVHRFRYFFSRWETLAYNGGMLFKVRQNPLRLLLVPFFLSAQLLLTLELLRRKDYDVIHAHWIIPQGIVAVLARMLSRSNPAVVLTSHGGDLFALKGPLLSQLKRWVINRVDHLTVVSSAMREKAETLGLTQAEIDVIPMGVDSQDTFFPSPNIATREGLIFVGRLVDKKGIEYLLRAMPRIRAEHPEAHLRIIGDGPLRDDLHTLCADLRITEHVTFEGALVNEAIPGFLQRAAIAVIPSVVAKSGDQEGAPVAIMETLACGCPTIVSDYPGARDIITDGETGLLVPQRDAEAIAEKVCFLLSNPEKQLELGAKGREFIQENYDWRVVSSKFNTVFKRHAGE